MGDALTRLCADMEIRRIGVACSGGSDSFGLLCLAKRWTDARGLSLVVFTVDHGLRPESGAEASWVRARAEKFGVEWKGISWLGEKPKSGLQEAARLARNALLDIAAHEAGASVLLTGHTRNDQAETVLMRLRRGSGPRGLAGMSAKRTLGFTTLLRPMLTLDRAEVQDWLREQGLEWLDDPSNRNMDFERVQIRRWLNKDRRNLVDGLSEAASEFGRWRRAWDEETLSFLRAHATVFDAGWVSMDREAFLGLAREAQQHIANRVIMAVSGKLYPKGCRQLMGFTRLLLAKGAGTIGGTRFIKDKDRILALRENRNHQVLRLCGHRHLHWDRRFAVTLNPHVATDCVIGPLGEDGWAEIVQADPTLRATTIPYPVRISLPAIKCALGVCETPHLGYSRIGWAGSSDRAFVRSIDWIHKTSLRYGRFVVA